MLVLVERMQKYGGFVFVALISYILDILMGQQRGNKQLPGNGYILCLIPLFRSRQDIIIARINHFLLPLFVISFRGIEK